MICKFVTCLATWCEELTHLKRPWCWERLRAGGEGDDRGWDGWMASPTQWTWVWVDSRSWWWTGRPGVLQSMGSQRVGHDWATELNWKNKEYHEFCLGIKVYKDRLVKLGKWDKGLWPFDTSLTILQKFLLSIRKENNNRVTKFSGTKFTYCISPSLSTRSSLNFLSLL